MGEEGKETGGEKKEGSGSSSSSDFPPKKQLVRQLDFTSSAVAGDGSSVPAEVWPTQSVAPTQENHQQARPLAPPTTSSAVAQQGQTPLRKPDSPKSRSRPNADVKEGTPKKQKQCNCRHSRCLKLYCECFASGIYCDGCNCVNCCNNVDNEAARRDAVETTLERNPNAFRPKIASSPHGTRVSREEAGDVPVVVKHNKGCHCKKSGCLKKYCECFQANILCSDNCKCMDCKNFEGSEERQALFHGDQANNITYIQQAANAAITGAIGSSGFAPHPVSKKRKGQENLFGSTVKDPSYRLAQFQQASHLRASVPSSSFSSHAAPRVGSTTASSPSKCLYRSLLADIIQPHDVKELCSVLVVLSAKVLEDMKKEIEKQANQTQTSASHEDRPPSQMETKNSQIVSQNCSTASQVQNSGPDHFKSDGTDAPAERPMSPGTLELMCDEQDMIFPGASPPNELFGHDHNRAEQVPYGPGMTEIYEEQERTILTKFRDTLNRLITCGQIKESRCSLSARSELGNKSDILSNGTTTARSGSANQQLPIGNGSEKVVSPASKPLQTPSSVVANAATDCSPAGKPSQMPSYVVANAATDWSLAGKPAQAPGSVVATADTHCRLVSKPSQTPGSVVANAAMDCIPAGKPAQVPGSVVANAAMDCGPAGKPAQVPGSVVAGAATHCRPAGKPSQVPGSVVANAAMDFSLAGKPSHTPNSVVANVGTDNGPAVQPDTQNGETSSKS